MLVKYDKNLVTIVLCYQIFIVCMLTQGLLNMSNLYLHQAVFDGIDHKAGGVFGATFF